jgi:trans-aconitate methyltransferase
VKPGAGVWRSGAAYEPYVGRWSRLVANAFLDWLQVPAGRRWLDVGCGTGALTAAILERCDPREVIRIDPSEAYVAPSSRALTTTGSHPSRARDQRRATRCRSVKSGGPRSESASELAFRWHPMARSP